MIFRIDHRVSVRSFATVFVFGLSAASACAHRDVYLANVGGQVAVGGANELGTVDEHFDIDTRVFEGVMIPSFPPIGPADYGRDEPGFFALPSGAPAFPAGASALPASAPVTIDLPSFSLGGPTDSLFFWNGLGAVDFQPISMAQPGVTMSVDPNPIDSTGPNSGMDSHPAFKLDDGGAGLPNDGVYLVSPTASVAGLANSKPFYMLWLVDALIVDEDAAEELEEALEIGQFDVFGKNFAFFDDAVDYVNRADVPEPASGLLLGLGIALVGTLSRKSLG